MSVNLYNVTTDTLKNVAGDIVNVHSVNEMIAPVEEGDTASRAYSEGEQFIIDGILYYAMTNIAQGDTFDYDVNYYESPTVSDQVNNKQDKRDYSLTTTNKNVVGAINEVNSNATKKWSGTDSGNTYVTVDKLAYDPTNKRLGLKVNGADTVIPFKSGVPLSSIAVTTMPTKTSYEQNENLDLTGIVVTATFEDGITAEVTNVCSFNPSDGTQLTTVGTIAITVSYYDITTSFNVTCVTWDTNIMANNSWSTIQKHISDGTLPSSFVGQTKPIILDGNTYNLQLARINDGVTLGTYYPNHTADFISLEYMPVARKMNSTATNSGGWRDSEMRAYLANTVYPALPEDLKAVIIDKTHKHPLGNKSIMTATVTDKLWLPTEYECFGTSPKSGETPTNNVYYSDIFPDATSRMKKQIGAGFGDPWWLTSPSMSDTEAFCVVNGAGSIGMSKANSSFGNGVVLGLRIG